MKEIVYKIRWKCSPVIGSKEKFVEATPKMINLLVKLDERYMPIDDKWTINLN